MCTCVLGRVVPGESTPKISSKPIAEPDPVVSVGSSQRPLPAQARSSGVKREPGLVLGGAAGGRGVGTQDAVCPELGAGSPCCPSG